MLYSTGSSAVMMFEWILLIFCSALYNVVDPETVGPVTRTSPYGLSIAFGNGERAHLEAQTCQVDSQVALIQNTHHDLLAEIRREC